MNTNHDRALAHRGVTIHRDERAGRWVASGPEGVIATGTGKLACRNAARRALGIERIATVEGRS